MVQYSYSLYTAAVTGDSDSRSEENGPPPTNGDYLNPPPVTSETPPETTGRRLRHDLTCYHLIVHAYISGPGSGSKYQNLTLCSYCMLYYLQHTLHQVQCFLKLC